MKVFLKVGFEHKFYDLGKVDYRGLPSRKKVKFNFDATVGRVPAEMLGLSRRVIEAKCAASGASACVFEVRWQLFANSPE